jgi:DNA-binding beta-propeller fold protein YncE
VPSLEARLIGTEPPSLPVTPLRAIGADPPWGEARGLAVLPDGRLAVGDSGNHRILVYRPDGRLERAWGAAGSGDGQFALISDLAAAPDGTLAVLDGDNHDIQLFTAGGALVAHLPAPALGLAYAAGIAWAPDDTLWVADTQSSRVVHVDRNGAVLGAFREGINGRAPLEQPVDVLVTPGGTVFVVDFHNRLARLNAAGLVDREWTLPVGAGRGGSRLALWADQIAITNPDTHTVRFLDLGAEVVRDLAPGPLTAAPLTWRMPVGVAAGPDNQLYVLDSGNNRVVVLGR